MSALFLSLLLVSAAGDPPLVHYAAKVQTKSWEPLPVAEVGRLVEAKALAALAKPGTMRIEKTGWAGLSEGDYSLAINGRFVEEAESFSVYFAFGKAKKEDLPSLHVAETAALGKLSRADMQRRIEEISTRAATRLAELLAPRLEAVRLSIPAPPLDDPRLPVSWGPVEVPEVKNPSQAIRILLDPRKEDHERHAALRDLSGHVFDQQPARNAVERCLLSDPSPDVRGRCAEALEAVARAHVPTQRVLLHAMRRELNPQVLSRLTQISTAFVGLSRSESIATWLELVSSESTPGESASAVSQLLAEESDVPNLDLAVARCLQQEALAYGKKSACAQWLLRKIPPARRYSVVAPYLSSVAVWEQGERNVYEDVAKLLREGNRKLEPAVAELFVELAVRPSAGRIRHDALYQLQEHPSPTPALIERLLPVLADADLAIPLLRLLREWSRDHPHLTQMIRGALERAKETVVWLPKPSRENPYRALDEALKQLAKVKP